MDAACSNADLEPVSLDFRLCASVSPSPRTKSVHEEETYVDMLARVSLLMVQKGLPVEVQCHGVKMLLHLLYSRKEELSSTNLADLRKILVGSLDDFVLKDATCHINSIDCMANLKENNKHLRCLLFVLAATETNAKEGEAIVNLSSNISSNSNWSSGGSTGIWTETQCSSLPEDFGDIAAINNACKELFEVYPAMANGEMMPTHQGKGSLLLMEHNIICQAFLVLTYYLGIQQCEEILLCLLSLLNKIWTLPDWRSTYLQNGSGLTSLFSDGQFLKMVYYLVRFNEVKLQRSRTEVFSAVKSYEHCLVTLLPMILSLLLEVIQCIHGLWYPSNAYNLSEVLVRAKYPDPSFPDEHTMNAEGSQAKKMRALIEGIRESGYKIIGLCASVEGAFSWLLNGSVCVSLSKCLESLEFRHLGKLIKHTVTPLIKNCPSMFWKEWTDNFLQPLLRHCENILHEAWFSLLFQGRARVPYYFGKLCGLEGTIKTLEREILLEFTREVSGLLEAVVLIEPNTVLPSTSLFRYLVTNDCFRKLRMSLFGYFVDGTTTAKAIPFCHALVCLAIDSKDARLRIFVMDDLLPCLIQNLDTKLPCAIQHLKSELNSSASGNARSHKLNPYAADNVILGLVFICQELYNSVYVQSQALERDKDVCNAGNTFEVWLRQQKEDFRTKAYSAAAKELPSGSPWYWEMEDECERYLSVYLDMLRLVDETNDFAENIYVDNEILFQKLSPHFRSHYAINSCAHPYIMNISSIQQRKFYSTADVVHNEEICAVALKLIQLKPCIKGSDRTFDVVHRLDRTSEIPPELRKYVVPSVELLLHSVLVFWEPRFHPMIRQDIMDKLLKVVDELTAKERCSEPLVPLIKDFPLHLQPYACALIETKLKESQYYDAMKQIRLHEQFDEFLASGKLDDDMQFIFSKGCVDEFVIKTVPSEFCLLEPVLRKLSFERRAKIVHMRTETCTYLECLQGLFANVEMKVEAQSLIDKLEAEGFFDVDNSQIDWGRTSFSELVDKFSSKLQRNSLPKHYAIRGIIDCRAVLLQTDVSQQEALEKVVVDIHSSLTRYLEKFWKDTRYYEHQYYDIVRNPLRQVNWGPRTREWMS